MIHGTAGKEEITINYFHSLHRYLTISREISTDSSQAAARLEPRTFDFWKQVATHKKFLEMDKALKDL